MTHFLANEHFPAASVRLLRRDGHDVAFVAEGPVGASDAENLARAVREQRIILTYDRHYGELIFQQGLPAPPGVVYFRLTQPTADEPATVLRDLLADPSSPLEGYFVTVGRNRIRRRPLPR